MIKVYVVAPDVYSGEVFNKVLKDYDINTELHFHNVAPRVIGDKINTSHEVVDDMNKMFSTLKDKTQSVVIACNTLQLWLPKIKDEYKQVKVYTTFEACEWKFKNDSNKPLWLGTTPLVNETKKFPTLLSVNDVETQDLVQELIWRVKMYGGDDIKTAPEWIKNDSSTSRQYQKIKMNKIKQENIKAIKHKKINSVILGCTELPIIFTNEKEDGINFYDPAKTLAEYVKSESIAILFSGGTISSVANNDGLREEGKAFDLLERLFKKIPGSLKKINITKSGVIYSGFSENMTDVDREKLCNSILEVLDKGISKVVVTHGTDSMEQTARYIDKKLKKILFKKKSAVVLTGSNDHAGSSKSDAWKNLKLAINANVNNQKSGVFVAFHNRLIKADEVVKEFFDGNQMNYISNKTLKYKLGVKKYEKWKIRKIQKIKNKYFKNILNPRIIEYKVNRTVDNHLEFLKSIQNLEVNGIIFILYHSSTANTTSSKSSVADLVAKLTQKGILCFGITENGDPTDLTKYPSSVKLKEAGLVRL